ncbi:baseplate assembly protein [Pseudoxanthomonas winnipegensis]|uniref:Baseplate assembly protein n=1 Tax=Pseudoxanthomonas winnipegensis TaxID=2480810 RepID=A0A4Q8LDC3_9GAMM|nr:baseplate J/gp47 family protein [Pseudoxanthomonas winnipegensis]TAA26570.1 baseplate assembly protein [Pseudoxanthomonas winnipegensis]
MSTFTAIDLSRLPAPSVVEVIDYEALLAEYLASLRQLDPTFDALVESEPAYKILQVAAYREMLLRQRINDAARAVMLASATGSDLDQLAALLGVQRLVLDAGDPTQGVDPTLEPDEDFRRRIQLAPEGFSVAGPEGAYIYHALSADPRVLDASASSPIPDDIRAIVFNVLAANGASAAITNAMHAALDAATWPGTVVISVLARAGTGAADADLIADVGAALAADDVRPLTDHVTVQSATITPYQVTATIYTFAGPDSSVVMAEARARLQTYVDASHRMGRDVTMSGLYAALHTEGVQRVEIESPAGDLVIPRNGAAYCTGVTLTHGGVDE